MTVTQWTEDDVLTRLREEIDLAGGQKAWAERNSISPAFLNDILKRRRGIPERVCDALGLSSRRVFEPKE